MSIPYLAQREDQQHPRATAAEAAELSGNVLLGPPR
jgi:hypothetical protein